MKNFFKLFTLVLVVGLTLSTTAWGADRYSVASGNWISTAVWSATSGGASGASAPGASDNAIIEGGFTVTLDANKSATNVTVKTGSILNAATFALTVSGTFTLEGGSEFRQGGTVTGVPGATRNFATTSTYTYNGTQAGLSGTPPTFGNLNFAPSPTGSGTFGVALVVAGNMTINLGTVQEIRFSTSTTGRTHSITGNLTIQGSSIVVGSNGSNTTGSATITVGGNLNVTSGTFRGTNDAGNATFNIAGNISNAGTWQQDDGSSTGTFAINLNGSSSSQDISGANAISFENLTINNSNGVTLATGVTVTGTLTFTAGRIEGSSLTRTITSGTTGIVNLMSANNYLNILASPTPTITSVTISSYPNTTIPNSGTFYDATKGVSRYYVITEVTGTGNVNPRFDYLVSEQGVNFVNTDGVVWAYTVGPWVNMGGIGAAFYAETTTPIAGASLAGKYAVAAAAAALPIQLGSFVGSFVNSNDVTFEWQTISEINNYGFWIQKRAIGSEEFITIDESFQRGKGTPSTYSWEYKNAVVDNTEFYLLQQDNDNLTSRFGPIMLNPNNVPNESVPAVFALNQNYPNPFNPATTISWQLAVGGYTTLKVYNVLGNEVATLFSGNAEAGKIYNSPFDGSKFSTGLYFYKIQSGNNVEVKKMTLVK